MTQESVAERAREVGLTVRTWSPGDGVTRYRFWDSATCEPDQGYFGPYDGMYTALGRKEALAFIDGWSAKTRRAGR